MNCNDLEPMTEYYSGKRKELIDDHSTYKIKSNSHIFHLNVKQRVQVMVSHIFQNLLITFFYS